MNDGSRCYLVSNFDSPDLIFPNVGSSYGQQAAEIDAVREGDAMGVRLTSNRASFIHVYSLPVWTNSAAGAPDVRFLSWSPNSASVAYTRESGGLYVAAAGSPVSSHTRIANGNYWWVDWSPDQDAVTSGLQTAIAFTGWASGSPIRGGVWSAQPNGSGLRLLAEAKQGKNSSQVTYIHYSPFWSPSGSHLAYTELAYNGPYGFIGVKSLRRMTKDGTGNVVLHTETSTVDFDHIFAWTDAN